MSKVCEYCGKVFERRANETTQAYSKRKKCKQGCIGETDAATEVSGFYAKETIEIGDCGIAECHMFTRSWFTQNAHWRKHY